MSVISSFQATIEAWKSIECGIVFVSGLWRWIRTVSPTFTRRTGPGTLGTPGVRLKEYVIWTKPSATVIGASTA